jgi:hypothetical protein
VFGTASDLPALNSAIMDDWVRLTDGVRVVPNLDRDRLADLPVYEARVVSDDGERSITYANPESAASRFADDWPRDVALTAATIRHDPDVLLTAFADGQVWFEGAGPERVPEVITNTVCYLWQRPR